MSLAVANEPRDEFPARGKRANERWGGNTGEELGKGRRDPLKNLGHANKNERDAVQPNAFVFQVESRIIKNK